MVGKPIETHYRGFRFRSRLEARWAVFFDALDITYKYEPEGFNLDGLYYLPDFYLPDYDYWIEVKPKEIQVNSEDWNKVVALSNHLKQTIFVAVGDVWFPYDRRRLNDFIHGGVRNYYRPVRMGGNIASHHWWIECPVCHSFSLVVFGHTMYCSCGKNPDGEIQFSDSERLVKAYNTARSARFEHGESPKFL